MYSAHTQWVNRGSPPVKPDVDVPLPFHLLQRRSDFFGLNTEGVRSYLVVRLLIRLLGPLLGSLHPQVGIVPVVLISFLKNL